MGDEADGAAAGGERKIFSTLGEFHSGVVKELGEGANKPLAKLMKKMRNAKLRDGIVLGSIKLGIFGRPIPIELGLVRRALHVDLHHPEDVHQGIKISRESLLPVETGGRNRNPTDAQREANKQIEKFFQKWGKSFRNAMNIREFSSNSRRRAQH